MILLYHSRIQGDQKVYLGPRKSDKLNYFVKKKNILTFKLTNLEVIYLLIYEFFKKLHFILDLK